MSLGLLLGLLVCLNKVENDLVHVARHYAGLPQMQDAEEVRKPPQGCCGPARRVARFVPFHRVFHSVELSLVDPGGGRVDLWLGGLATQWLLIGLVSRPASPWSATWPPCSARRGCDDRAAGRGADPAAVRGRGVDHGHPARLICSEGWSRCWISAVST